MLSKIPKWDPDPIFALTLLGRTHTTLGENLSFVLKQKTADIFPVCCLYSACAGAGSGLVTFLAGQPCTGLLDRAGGGE